MHQTLGQNYHSRLLRPLTLLGFLLSAALSHPAWAATMTSARAGSNPPMVAEGGGSANASHSFNSPDGLSQNSSAFASPARLSASVTSTGYPQPYSAAASFSVAEDTTFNYQPDYMGGQDDWVEVGLTGALSGTIVGTSLGGTGSARARVTVSGNIWTAPPDEGGTFVGSVTRDTGDRGGSVRSFNESQIIDVTEFVSTGRIWVPRGETVSFSAALSAQVFSDRVNTNYGTVAANFADTFAFDPYKFFDIYTPGITATSPSLGLVDNQLVDYIVPEPAALPMIVSGLVIVGSVWFRRSKSVLADP